MGNSLSGSVCNFTYKKETAHHYLLHSAEELVFSLDTKNYVGQI
jgi:hypothetical protein